MSSPVSLRFAAAVVFGLATCWIAPGDALARPSSHQTAQLSPFDHAQKLREALEGSPEQQRTRRDYEHVMDAFRTIYHGDPASPKADASIAAVADLLAEEGRLFQDEKALHDAVGQYEFLRREYPASRFRANALLTEGEIYRRDLGDSNSAKATFQQLLKSYPQSPLAEQARTELKEIHQEELAAKHSGRKASDGTRAGLFPSAPGTTVGGGSAQSTPKAPNAMPDAVATQRSSQPEPATRRDGNTTATAPSAAKAAPKSVSPAVPTSVEPAPTQATEAALNTTPPPRRGKLPLVTGIRHWSTSVYTRVAIDLEDEVQYEAARVPNPDRIYFDLHGAKLSPELIGKSFDVTDDGFLKRIRAAQFSGDVTRIVLDVSDVSDYSAFLLPNPYRLIIDIHGSKQGAPQQGVLTSKTPPANSTLPAAAVAPRIPVTTQQPPAISPKSAPSTSTDAAKPATKKASSMQEVASLGREPNRVKATQHPTTAPIAASVTGTTPAPQQENSSTAANTTVPPVASAASAAPASITRSANNASKKTSEKTATTAQSSPAALTTHEATPTANGERSLVRALGLKIGRIVVDAGHGGHDSGTLGPDGIEEKEVVLDVALRLGKMLKQRLGADVIYTRDDDTFIPLETRTAIANKAQADLFISVHANSSHDPSARGVETYYLNFTSSPDALEVAARENAVSDQSIHQLSDLVKKIALKDKIDESREFAFDVQQGLFEGLETGNRGLKDRGVKKAPFVVLIGANMPSILAEISFLTNPDDARQLRDPNYRERIAESLYKGVTKYISGLSGIRTAQNGSKVIGN